MTSASRTKSLCQMSERSSTYPMCSGCQRWLCVKHFNEHRQELGHQMDHLSQQHDELHQDLISTNEDQHPLFIRIDKWKQRSMERIRQVADDVRQNLKHYISMQTK